MSLALEARQFLRSTRSGILSTLSIKFPGYPFGSVAPFILDHTGQPVLLISTIAEHTKNILADAKVSLLVFAGSDDLQASSRLTMLGEAQQISKEDEDLRARYLRYFPNAVSYFEMHDFSFYRITITQARYIAGFGKMSWMTGSDLCGTALAVSEIIGETGSSGSSPLSAQETGIIEHMNTDHINSMIAYCKHFHGVMAEQAEMLGIDSDGFDVLVKDKDEQSQMLRFTFEQPIHDAQSARMALVAMSKAVRA